MGEVVGLNHIAIHEYLKMMGYEGTVYRLMFWRILEVDRMFRDEWKKQEKSKEVSKRK